MKKIVILLLFGLYFIGCTSPNNVVTKKSGLMFSDDTLGTGAVVKVGDYISINFRAWMIKDSTNLFKNWVADTSRTKSKIGDSYVYQRPIKYFLGTKDAFVRGTDGGIEGMKVGGTRTIIIPSKLAYGEKGFRTIPGNTNLKIVVQLIATHTPQKVKPWDIDAKKYKKTKSGLKYFIVKKGMGAKPDSGDAITINYSGYLTDGKKFDSSIERGEPITYPFKVQPMIKGFQEGTAMMNKGSKYRLLIPSKLAYGKRTVGLIPANSDLMFDIEMVDIKKPEKKK